MTNDAERVNDIVASAWMVTRPGNNGTVFPKLYLLEADADAMVAYVTVNPPASKVALYTADIIEAQSKALAEARVVKPLEWRLEVGNVTASPIWRAETIVGRYTVVGDLWWGPEPTNEWANAADADACKVAAQSDYEQRILSALTPTPENPNG